MEKRAAGVRCLRTAARAHSITTAA